VAECQLTHYPFVRDVLISMALAWHDNFPYSKYGRWSLPRAFRSVRWRRYLTEPFRRAKTPSFVLICVQEITSMGNTTTVTVRVSAALKNRLDKLADATARSRSWLAAHALQVYVEDQEWQLAVIRKGKKDMQAGRTVSHEKTARWLRSWGKKRELPPPSCE
jgi:RHH-type rel operon transcriptional repressor/antitoxin RelB